MNTIWAVWVALTLGSFAVLETLALLSRREGDTLSERLREWLGIRPVKHWRVAGVALVVGFCAWFAWHIAFQQG